MSAANATQGQTISLQIINTVSSQLEVPAVELPPLSSAVDPDALDRLYASDPDSIELVFQYAGFAIHVDDNRETTLSELPN